jgi:hypothetical protein
MSIDADLESAKRAGDRVAVLKLRERTGELTEAHIKFAASLGHEAALALFPGAQAVDWREQERCVEAIAFAMNLLGDSIGLRVGVDWAQRAIRTWPPIDPDDTSPQDALAAVRAWLHRPCKERVLAVERTMEPITMRCLHALQKARDDAFRAADAVARGTGEYDSDAYDAVWDPANAVAEFRAHAGSAVEHVATFCWELTHVPSGVAYADHGNFGPDMDMPALPYSLAYAADEAALASKDLEAEQEWQRLRLAAYVLGEVDLDEPAT